MRIILMPLLMVVITSLMSGCASYPVSDNRAVCFPHFDLADEAVYGLNKHNKAKIYAIECLCRPQEEACKE